MKRADSIAGLLGLALSIFVIWATSNFPENQMSRVGPAFFPKFLAFGLGFFSLLLLFTAFTQKKTVKVAHLNLKDPGCQRVGIALAATVIYCFVLNYFGFIVSAIIFLLFLMFLLKERRYFQMVTIACIVTGTIFLVFKVFLNITLPMGAIYGF